MLHDYKSIWVLYLIIIKIMYLILIQSECIHSTAHVYGTSNSKHI